MKLYLIHVLYVTMNVIISMSLFSLYQLSLLCHFSCTACIYELNYVNHIIFVLMYKCNILCIVISLWLCEIVSFIHVLSITMHLIITMPHCFYCNIILIVHIMSFHLYLYFIYDSFYIVTLSFTNVKLYLLSMSYCFH